MGKYRIGIIGMGRMGVTHSCILKTDPRVEVTCLADTSRLVRNVFQKHLGIRPYKSFHELLNAETPDAVIVCTPPHLHRAVTEEALEAGSHAFVEKPFTASERDAAALVDGFGATKLVNQVGYVNRFNDVFRAARRMIKGGVIGDVKECHSTMLSGTVIRPVKAAGWRAGRSTGGGAIFEMASHAIDLMHFLVGAFDRVKNVKKRSIFSAQVEDAVDADLASERGVAGSITINWSDLESRKPTNRIDVIGSRGEITANQHGMRIRVEDAVPEFKLVPGWNDLEIPQLSSNVPFYLRGNEYTAQLVHFIDCIEKGGAPADCTFSDAYQTLKLLTQLAEA